MQVRLSGNNYSIEAKGNEVIYNEQMDNSAYKKFAVLHQIPVLAVALLLVVAGFVLNLTAVAIVILFVSIAYFSVLFFSLKKIKGYYLLTDTDIYVFNNMGVNNHRYDELISVEINKGSKIVVLKFNTIPKKLVLFLGIDMDTFLQHLVTKTKGSVEFNTKQSKKNKQN